MSELQEAVSVRIKTVKKREEKNHITPRGGSVRASGGQPLRSAESTTLTCRDAGKETSAVCDSVLFSAPPPPFPRCHVSPSGRFGAPVRGAGGDFTGARGRPGEQREVHVQVPQPARDPAEGCLQTPTGTSSPNTVTLLKQILTGEKIYTGDSGSSHWNPSRLL